MAQRRARLIGVMVVAAIALSLATPAALLRIAEADLEGEDCRARDKPDAPGPGPTFLAALDRLRSLESLPVYGPRARDLATHATLQCMGSLAGQCLELRAGARSHDDALDPERISGLCESWTPFMRHLGDHAVHPDPQTYCCPSP